MKIFPAVGFFCFAFALISPGVFAQPPQATPATRAQVTQELRDLLAVGYRPDDIAEYPDNYISAQQRLDVERAAGQKSLQ